MTGSKSAGRQSPPSGSTPKVWHGVPPRNKYFTGREELLADLHRQLTERDVAVVLPHALHGMGGVGKTLLAVEFCHRHKADYELVWWILADQEVIARSTLASLAEHFEITGGGVDDLLPKVLDRLRRGDRFGKWLLVFDNADEPESIRDLMPDGPGHVLVTSRNRGWIDVAETLDVDVFHPQESIELLRSRVPTATENEARELAEELGDLPLAVEQAASFLRETAMPVREYLELLGRQAVRILSEGVPLSYPAPVALVGRASEARLQAEVPQAIEVFRRCAFFGPGPIKLDFFETRESGLSPTLREIVTDEFLLRKAVGALHRYALARVDSRADTIEVHRLLQRLIRDRLDADERDLIRHDVHLMLAAYDRGHPDERSEWPRYANLLVHAGPSEIVQCRERWARELVGHLVRYLYEIKSLDDAKHYAEQAMSRWTADSGEDDKDVLVVRRHLGNVLFALGSYRDADALNEQTLARMREVLGSKNQQTLMLINSHAADLRAKGEFAKARELDEDSVAKHREVFGDTHFRTFRAVGNLALDYRIAGDYPKALGLHEENCDALIDFYEGESDPEVLFALDNLARTKRSMGDYAGALETAQRVNQGFRDLVERGGYPADHDWVLRQMRSLSITLRKTGSVAESVELAADAHERYRRKYGEDHGDTLGVAVSLANARRLAGELQSAAAGLESAMRGYQKVLGAEHPYTQVAAVDLAIARRRLDDPAAARDLLETALVTLRDRMGEDHDFTLCCATNLASALADLGETGRASELGTDALARFRATLGQDHPHTLACAANLALDLRAAGRDTEANELTEEILTRFRETLGEGHPELTSELEGKRLDLELEPPPI